MLRNIEIKPASLEDAKLVQEITQDAFARYVEKSSINETIDALEESVEDIERDIATGFVFIAFINNKPAGSFRILFDDENTARIARFGVTTEFRRIGVGNQLIYHAETILKEEGVKEVYLFTALNNKRLLHFYRRHKYFLDSVEGTGSYPRAKLVKIMK